MIVNISPVREAKTKEVRNVETKWSVGGVIWKKSILKR